MVIREVLVHGDVRRRWPWFILGLFVGSALTVAVAFIAGGIG